MSDDPMKPGAVIYFVCGTQGEYSDLREWVVCGYADKAKAEEHVALLTQWVADNRSDDIDYLKVPLDPVGGELSSWTQDREYSVSWVFVHGDPKHFELEHQVTTDAAREQGLIP